MGMRPANGAVAGLEYLIHQIDRLAHVAGVALSAEVIKEHTQVRVAVILVGMCGIQKPRVLIDQIRPYFLFGIFVFQLQTGNDGKRGVGVTAKEFQHIRFADAFRSAKQDALMQRKLTRQKIVSGCYIYRNWALCYWFQLDTESEALCSIIHWFHKNQLVFAGIAIGNEKKFWSDEEALRSSLPLKDYDRYAGILGDILLFMNFLEYAPIETKEVGANKRVKDLNVKYCNQTETNVRIIDSKWFTTLIKTQGFGVRGHLRLQAVGPGKREKRFVWVTDYVKKGYTRIAQKLQNEQ